MKTRAIDIKDISSLCFNYCGTCETDRKKCAAYRERKRTMIKAKALSWN